LKVFQKEASFFHQISTSFRFVNCTY